MTRGKATLADARAIVCMAHRRYQMQLFPVDLKGRHFAALKAAERNGWIWFFKTDVAAVTAEGLKVIGDYQGQA